MTAQIFPETTKTGVAPDAGQDAPSTEPAAPVESAQPADSTALPGVTDGLSEQSSQPASESNKHGNGTEVPSPTTKPTVSAAGGKYSASEKASPYAPLSLTEHSIRLVKIHRSENIDSPIVCDLVETAFADQRRFEALSYMWGEETADEKVTVNGVKLGVGKNLRDALRYLRRRPSTIYWIDALCINQDDIPERNKQVGLMRHVYERAQCVLIWLGSKYAVYEEHLAELKSLGYFQPQGDQADAEKKDGASKSQAERNMAQELYDDPYWSRLWIIQEIGLARQVEICFGNSSVSWDGFVHFQTMHNLGDASPFIIQRQRSQRFRGGNTLLKLLEAHKDARCKDPRDKVYGLVGLALDARGFRIDYARSRYQIWSDLMEFCNDRRLFGDLDVMQVASLAKYALMGAESRPLLDILRPYDAGDVTNDTSPSPRVFELQTVFLGLVTVVGPRPQDVVANMDAVDLWDRSIQENFLDDISHAHYESDRLKKIVYDLDFNTLGKKCSNFKSTISWNDELHARVEYLSKSISKGTIPNFQLSFQPQGGQGGTTSAKGTYRLFQMQHASSTTVWKMGIATGNIRAGDLIYWVPGSWRAIVVHPLDSEKLNFNVVGTATVTDDLEGCAPETHNQRMAEWRNSYYAKVAQVDARTILTLIEDGGSTCQYS